MSKVTIKLDDAVVHTADSITAAEEWLVEHGDRERTNDYQFDTAADAVDDFLGAGEGDDTEAPAEEEPLNDMLDLRGALAELRAAVTRYENDDELDEAKLRADEVLANVTDSRVHPMLEAYDRMITQGREDLITAIEGGTIPNLTTEAVTVGGLTTGDAANRPVLRPMLANDLLDYLRAAARRVFNLVGSAPAYHAIPGLQMEVLELAEAAQVPLLDDYQNEKLFPPGTFEVMARHVATRTDYKVGNRTVDRDQLTDLPKALQPVAH
jgi:hypothetical protein